MSQRPISALMLVATFWVGLTLMFVHERQCGMASAVAGKNVAGFVMLIGVVEFRNCSDVREY